MAMAIDKIGHISRQINPDTFSELIRAIIAQQISGIAAQTIWQRLTDLTSITPTALTQLSADDLQGIGVSYRKAGYIQAIAWDILDNQLDLDELHTMGDDEIKQILTAFKGVGEWTAQMLMIFSLNRMNVLSHHDLAILRGLRMLYRHRKISPQLFAKYQRRFAPYNSVASLYLWEIAGGALGNFADRIFRDPGFWFGHVVDYISVGSFAVFNIADAAITCGVVIFIGAMLLAERRAENE